jgi:hypothetical protein
MVLLISLPTHYSPKRALRFSSASMERQSATMARSSSRMSLNLHTQHNTRVVVVVWCVVLL